MRILVTGGAGYLGSVLIEKLLENDCKVVCYDNLMRGGQSLLPLVGSDLEFIKGDITDINKLEEAFKGKIDCVVHLAALVGVDICNKNRDLAGAVNVDGTDNVAQLAQKHKCRLIYPSTMSVYDSTQAYVDEESTPRPTSWYACSKYDAEKYVMEVGGKVIRLTTLCGPSPNFRLDILPHTLANEALLNNKIRVYQPNVVRSFLHVNDCAYIIRDMLFNYKKLKANLYNIGFEKDHWSKRQIAEKFSHNIELIEGADEDTRDFRCKFERLHRDLPLNHYYGTSRSSILAVSQNWLSIKEACKLVT
jgi:nucleoside-diphosphate-sugar epimerase